MEIKRGKDSLLNFLESNLKKHNMFVMRPYEDQSIIVIDIIKEYETTFFWFKHKHQYYHTIAIIVEYSTYNNALAIQMKTIDVEYVETITNIIEKCEKEFGVRGTLLT